MEIVARNGVIAFQTKDTSVIREILTPRNSSITTQSLAEATLAAGMATQAHCHPCTQEIYYLLQGSGLIAIETEHSTVQAGDAILIPAGCRHQIRNTGATDLVFLCCCTPAYTDEDTVMCLPLLPP